MTSFWGRLFGPSEVDGPYREIHLQPADPHNFAKRQAQFIGNAVVTAKYTPLSFIPRCLLEQFRRVANSYFLFISFLMLLGTYTNIFDSPLAPWSTLLPLIVVLAISAGKEGAEDLKRHRADRVTNDKLVTRIVLRAEQSSAFEQIHCSELLPGDLVRIDDENEVPADTVILITSDSAGLAYIETSNIDGESNLKIKHSLRTAWKTPQDLAR